MADAAGTTVLTVDGYFCGQRVHDRGPYAFLIRQGRIVDIVAPASTVPQPPDAAFRFALPGLVEAHAHLFLDGARLDPAERSAQLRAGRETLLVGAATNLQAALAAGVFLVRDAGDRHGINDELRSRPGSLPRILSAGRAIRRQGCYGALMSVEVASAGEALAAVEQIAPAADWVKVMLTGIVDFASGAVTGELQFEASVLRSMVMRARAHGKPLAVHCSGVAGIEAAIAAGVDAIEHGYFMTPQALRAMAADGIAWVPTLAPVQFQFAQPQHAGWAAPVVANIDRILAGHRESIALADALGVTVLAGSDAGSPGVAHGGGLIDELRYLLQAGLSLERVLQAATSLPRSRWGCSPADLVPGAAADFVLLDESPGVDPAALARVAGLCLDGELQLPPFP